MAAGRPKMEITPEVWKEICDQVAQGNSIRKVLKSNPDKYPQWDRFRAEKDVNAEFNAQYVKAIQDKGEMEVCDIDEICDELKQGKLDASAANVLIQAKKWKAAKFYPKMYGEKITQEHTGKDGKDLFSQMTDEELNDKIQKFLK